jgi:hypothetical protein
VVVRKLVRLGPDVVPHLLALSAEFAEAGHIEAIAGALAKLRSDRLDPYLIGVLEKSPTPRRQLAAYDMLEEHGSPAAVHEIIRLMPENPPRLMRRIEGVLTALMKRHDTQNLYMELAQRVRSYDVNTTYRVVGCMANAGSLHAVGILGDLIGTSPGLDLVVVSGLARMQIQVENRDAVLKLRSLLTAADPNLRRECAMALGIFRVVEAVEALIDLLLDPDAGVKNSAHWSLKAISKLNLPPEPQVWRMWLAKEREWWEGEGKAVKQQLDSGDPAAVVDAIRLLVVRPLFAREFEPKLKLLAESGSGDVRDAALAALGGKKVPAAGRMSGGPSGAFRPIPSPTAAGDPGGAADAGAAEEESVSGGSMAKIVFVVLVIVLGLYVFGILHPDRIRGWFGARS